MIIDRVESTIITPDMGVANRAFLSNTETVRAGHSYRDKSVVCIVPAVADIPPRIVSAWRNMMTPMNEKFCMLMAEGFEVGDAYSTMIENVLAHDELSKWKYILTLETDNAPPPDGLLKLIQDIESGPWAAVGGLYWTKGEGGEPMCYGNPAVMPKDFKPWLPEPNTVAECNGLGMGMTLFKMSLFRDKEIKRPWFRTVQDYTPGVGAQMFTQDLAFFHEAGKRHRFACSTRVLVGHYDSRNRVMW